MKFMQYLRLLTNYLNVLTKEDKRVLLADGSLKCTQMGITLKSNKIEAYGP